MEKSEYDTREKSMVLSHLYREKLIKGGRAMSEVLQEIKERRSIRKYKPDSIPQETLDKIIEAGLYAASGMGQQNTIICLLYTSPSPRDTASSRMPSSA